MQIAEYVRQREGEYYVNSSRVTLHSIITDWKRGCAPEQIAADFPSVPLVAIYGAITTYLERQQDFDQHFARSDAATAREKAAIEAAHSAFYGDMRARLAQVRPRVQTELRAHGILPAEPAALDDAESAPHPTSDA
jgi:uncharacterized protein (DUF433 family)